MRSWYVFNLASAGGAATVSITDEIGIWGVSAQRFISDLKNIGGDTLDVEINSPGGSVFDGLAIYNALRNSGKTINVRVLGLAASIASLIAMAGDKITMPANAFMMVHNPLANPGMANAEEMREYADFLDKIGTSLVGTYVARTGKSEDEIKALLSAETYMTAEEALANGFIDEVTPVLEVTAKFDVENLPENVRAVFDKAVKPVVPATAPVVEADTTVPFATQVDALCAQAGLAEFSTLIALGHSDIGAVKERISNAREIKSLCALAKRDADAELLIKSGKNLADARVHLTEVLAIADERNHVDTTLQNSTTQTVQAQQSAFSTAAVWAARRAQTGVKA